MYASYPSVGLEYPSLKLVHGSRAKGVKSPTRYFRVKNLTQHQHYTKRNPPWIKLHASTLEDYDFARLQDASKMHLCAIWLLASRTDNKIPWDSEWIAKRINATAEVDLNSLQDAGFIELVGPASNTLATCKQSALPETEGEGEGERETEGEGKRKRKVPASKTKSLSRAASADTWEAYSRAYLRRYSVEPTRNQKVNSQLAQFCKRVPLEEAPDIASFYLRHNNAYYIRTAHSTDALLKDAEKLRTEWQTGHKVTNKRALQDEATATNFDNAEEAKRILRRINDEPIPT